MATKNFRLQHGISQAKAAEICGCSRWLIIQWENGQSSPTLAQLQMLANYCGCTIIDILQAPEASRKRTSKRRSPK